MKNKPCFRCCIKSLNLHWTLSSFCLIATVFRFWAIYKAIFYVLTKTSIGFPVSRPQCLLHWMSFLVRSNFAPLSLSPVGIRLKVSPSFNLWLVIFNQGRATEAIHRVYSYAMDCKQSPSCLKIRGVESETNERASVTVSVTCKLRVARAFVAVSHARTPTLVWFFSLGSSPWSLEQKTDYPQSSKLLCNWLSIWKIWVQAKRCAIPCGGLLAPAPPPPTPSAGGYFL